MGHVSRLQRAQERQRLIGHDGSYMPFSADPSTPPPGQAQQIGIEALVPMLIQQGAVPSYRVHVNRERQAVAVVAVCGPIEIALPFSAADARKLAEQIGQACDQAEAAAPAPAPPDETEGRVRPDDAPEHRPLAILP